jgi:hypothetical protein
MLDIPTPTLRAEDRQVIEDLASLLAPWGLPLAQGRVYAYVLLSPAPVGLDQIATDLEMSKAGAWSAATQLERFGHIKRHGTPGSKRARYGPSEDLSAVMAAHNAMLGSLGQIFERSAVTAASGAVAARMQELADLYLTVWRTVDDAIREVKAKHAAQAG